MENLDLNRAPDIPYIAHEAALARLERINKRLWILCLVVFLAFVASNAGWIWFESQFEDQITITQEADTGNSPAYVNGTGEMTINGEGKTNNN